MTQNILLMNFTSLDMQKIISTRTLLRNFSEMKKLLTDKKVEALYVDLGKEQQLKLTIERKNNPLQDVLQKIQKRPLRKLQRPKEDLFV